MKNKIKIIIKLLLLAAVPAMIFSGCGSADKKTNSANQVKLEMWDLYGDSGMMNGFFGEFKKINPSAGSMRYRKLTGSEYKQALIEAMASRQEPDIFLIHSTWLPYFQNKIAPVPKSIFTEQELRATFPDVVARDFLAAGEIYALPLSIDSLALFYNKDYFNKEGIVKPPATWGEFNEYVKKITKIDGYGNILLSGAAMGASYNINRSTDILALLMLQNKAQMNDDSSRKATFSQAVNVDGNRVEAGNLALDYYTQFAKSNSPLYSWNSFSHWSIDAFAEGTAAMMLNYSWNFETVKSKNAKLNFAVAPVPQMYPEESVNYANYWAFAVAKNKDKKTIHEAWQFLRFLTANNNGQMKLVDANTGIKKSAPLNLDPAKVYVTDKKVPAARLDIIEEQKNDTVLGPFAFGNLIAKSWYQPSPEKNETILADAINSVNVGSATVKDALETAENRINKLSEPAGE